MTAVGYDAFSQNSVNGEEPWRVVISGSTNSSALTRVTFDTFAALKASTNPVVIPMSGATGIDLMVFGVGADGTDVILTIGGIVPVANAAGATQGYFGTHWYALEASVDASETTASTAWDNIAPFSSTAHAFCTYASTSTNNTLPLSSDFAGAGDQLNGGLQTHRVTLNPTGLAGIPAFFIPNFGYPMMYIAATTNGVSGTGMTSFSIAIRRVQEFQTP